MSQAEILIRRLGREDAESYRAIRLAGLKDTPEAFAALYEVEAERPLQAFEERVTSLPVFGAFLEGRLIGTAGFLREAGEKERHKGLLWGMYVDPSARGFRVGARLVQAVLDHAAGEVEQVRLAVGAFNETAIGFYERMGFVTYGREPKSLKGPSGYSDDILMVRFLNGHGG